VLDMEEHSASIGMNVERNQTPAGSMEGTRAHVQPDATWRSQRCNNAGERAASALRARGRRDRS